MLTEEKPTKPANVQHHVGKAPIPPPVSKKPVRRNDSALSQTDDDKAIQGHGELGRSSFFPFLHFVFISGRLQQSIRVSIPLASYISGESTFLGGIDSSRHGIKLLSSYVPKMLTSLPLHSQPIYLYSMPCINTSVENRLKFCNRSSVRMNQLVISLLIGQPSVLVGSKAYHHCLRCHCQSQRTAHCYQGLHKNVFVHTIIVCLYYGFVHFLFSI